MPRTAHSATPPRWSIAFLLLLLLLSTLLIAGGASRADVMGQAVTRGAAWLVLMTAIVLGVRPLATNVTVLLFLSAAVLLALLQLVPLPPGLWQMLPGRQSLEDALVTQNYWRPLSLAPGATINAASSLVVPLGTLLLVNSISEAEQRWLPGVSLGLISASTIVGLLQLSGTRFDNPFINDTVGQVSGTFANRNHFALFVAFGCMMAPVWALANRRRLQWRAPVALGLVLLFMLTILASGSRAGMLVGALALAMGLGLSWQSVGQARRGGLHRVFPALIVAIIATLAIFVLISVQADRAEAINRAFGIGLGQDMRGRALPTVLTMIGTYFPAGTGFGSFDPMFRMHEPFELLKRSYFNHAHNDLLEVVLDGGLPALLLLLAALGWWALASIRVWRVGAEPRYMVPKLGSATLLLIIIASIFDYPVRTPMMMAMAVIAAIWLNQGAATVARSPLPKQGQHL